VKFSNLSISSKLVAVFAGMLATIAAGGVALYLNNASLAASAARTERARQVLSAAQDATFRLARQENSLRGFLLSGDNYYAKRINETHKVKFFDAIKQLRSLAIKDAAVETQTRETAAQTAAMQRVTLGLVAGILLLAALALACGVILARSIGAPVRAMTQVMRRLAAGDNEVVVPAADRKDEVGDMAKAVQSFKDGALARIRLEGEAESSREEANRQRVATEAERARVAAEQTKVVEALALGLSRLSAGDLTCRIDSAFTGSYEQLRNDFNDAVSNLERTLGKIQDSSSAMSAGAGEISQAADNLARRTEAQAATLEQTAAALDEITATVRKTASGAQQADGVVSEARASAEASSDVVSRAVAAMDEISTSSNQISQIIGVIDEIAFQTNLLALNAGVEAARAGEAGKGFAVVASEVRALAQRSAEAAKEIKSLISVSTNHVGSGVELVGQTGEALQHIFTQFSQVAQLVTEIAASAREQASALGQVNTAINQMDSTTQQNAAMVEESTAASHTLSRQARDLSQLISAFKVHPGAGGRDVGVSAAPMRKAG